MSPRLRSSSRRFPLFLSLPIVMLAFGCSSSGSTDGREPSVHSVGAMQAKRPRARAAAKTTALATDAGDGAGEDDADAHDAWMEAYFGGDADVDYLRYKAGVAAAE